MFRNPSPPPEHHTADNVDRIGDSVYSQCWVLNALVSLSSQSKKEDETISEDEENLWCQLWDMSADREVGGFMLEKGACDLLLAPLVRSTNYRVREVALGVLGNMLCHSKHAKVITSHTVLLNFIPTMMKEDDVAVLTETIRLIRAALAQDNVCNMWLKALPEDTVERTIHIMQSTLEMRDMRPSILSEHCAHLLECLFYHDESLLINSAYTVFPIVEVLKHPRCTGLREPLLRCLQYLSEEPTAVKNMARCSALPAVMHSVMSEKQDYSLVAVCLSLICTLLSANCDDMTAWLEKDGTIVDMTVGTLQRILNDDGDDGDGEKPKEETPVPDEQNDKEVFVENETKNGEEKEKENIDGQTEKKIENKPIIQVQASSPHVRLVTPTYGTPANATPNAANTTPVPSPSCPTPQTETPYSTRSTPYSMQRKGFTTPSTRLRRTTSEPAGPIIQVCREMCWNFFYTLANNVPTEGSCMMRYISNNMAALIECFSYVGDSHVELAMLYKQHLDKYPHFAKTIELLNHFIMTHTELP